MKSPNNTLPVACAALLSVVLWVLAGRCAAVADPGLASETKTDLAIAKYGLTGKGVIVAILDRGIDYTHPAGFSQSERHDAH